MLVEWWNTDFTKNEGWTPDFINFLNSDSFHNMSHSDPFHPISWKEKQESDLLEK